MIKRDDHLRLHNYNDTCKPIGLLTLAWLLNFNVGKQNVGPIYMASNTLIKNMKHLQKFRKSQEYKVETFHFKFINSTGS